MQRRENAVVATATVKGIVYHTNPKKTVKYGKKAKDRILPENKPQVKRKEVKKIHLNMVQRQMYRRLMYGMKEYDKEQIKAMSTNAIKRVEEDYKIAKRAIHVLKAKTCFHAENKLISVIFNKKNLGKNDYDWYIDIPKEYTLRKLGISTGDIINDFIKRKLLPDNFYSLTPQTIKL